MEKVEDLIVKCSFTVKPTLTLRDALKRLSKYEADEVPVVDEKNVYIGIFKSTSTIYIKENQEEHIINFINPNTPLLSPKQVISDIKLDDVSTSILPVVEEKKFIGVVNVGEIIHLIKKDYDDLRQILEHSHDGIAISNVEGVTERVNRAWDRITGLKREEVIGKPLEELVKKKIFSDSVSIKVIESKKTVTIVQQMKSGKQALITGKPIFDETGHLSKVVMNLRDITELQRLKEALEKKDKLVEGFYTEVSQMRSKHSSRELIIANSAPMKELIYLAAQIARVDSTVLLTGESGVGKGVLARYIHRSSPREKHPFITVNCGAIPRDLFESELFGYAGGAFTGANPKGKKGLFELAEGGTLFLDEIAEIPLELQVKLLNVLQEKKITRIGGTTSIDLDVRIISATNRNLFDLVRSGEFREDLYYRLNVVPISIPPLRDRKEDIVSLVRHYINVFNKKYHLNKCITDDVLDKIFSYSWPGNVRELENFIERYVVTNTSDQFQFDNFITYNIHNNNYFSEHTINSVTVIPTLREAQNNLEKKLIKGALNKAGTQVEAARILNISLSTLIRKMKKLNIT